MEDKGIGAVAASRAERARATAEETPTPMPLFVVCRTIITQGNASEAPASAFVPMRPRKNPSNVTTPANASRLRTFGAARRSRVGRIGPSSSILVHAAAAGDGTVLTAADEGAEIGGLRSLIGRSLSSGGIRAALETKRPCQPDGCVTGPTRLIRGVARSCSRERQPQSIISRGGIRKSI